MSYGKDVAAGTGADLAASDIDTTENLTLQNSPLAKAKPQRGKAGHSARAVAERRKTFVEAYLANGHNAMAAAKAAGYSGSRLKQTGWRLLRNPDVQRSLTERAQKVAELAQMNTANWAAELRAIAFANIGDLYDPEGKLIKVARLPRHVLAAIRSIKLTNDGDVIEFKFWDKVGSLNTMARHLGLFERDNAQQSDITVRVELVG